MSQSKKMSAVEAVVNTVVGLVVAPLKKLDEQCTVGRDRLQP